MRYLALVLLLIPMLASGAEHHSLVRVDLSVPGAEARFHAVAGALDVLMVKPGSYAELAVTAADRPLLERAGLAMDVVTPDMEASFAFRDKGPGYGIYHTWSENIAFVDSLRLLYPQVISAKWSIGQSLEGRDIWAFRVSANPDVDENEPEILFDAAHHAREVMSAEFAIMFAEYLAQNYGTDPEITWLLDNRELYIVPVVNPDGFVYNETIEPDGGGMWRKNRRDNGDGTLGVDLNRNYPHEWGYDDSGSSPDPSSATYRGTAPGSEPETQAMMAFINGREFKTEDSIHTYGNWVLYPWAYYSTPAPDAAVLSAMAAEMASRNGYTAAQSIGYAVNGDTTDWSYGATGEHSRIFAFTTEIGASGDGFWPAESRRGALFRENIHPHLFLMRSAGAFMTAHSAAVTPTILKSIDPGDLGLLTFSVQNQSGFETSAPVTVTLASDDPWLYLHETSRTVGSLAPMAADDLTSYPVAFSLHADTPPGHLATVRADVPQISGSLEFPLTFLVGTGGSLFADDFESGTSSWVLDGAWATTTAQSQSPTHSLTDSPGGDYPDQTTTSATLGTSLRATAISFQHRHEIEDGWDYGHVQVRPVGGDWTSVASYTGAQTTWTGETVTLESFEGQELEIRFVMETDYSVIDDGWYIDDVEIFGFPTANLAPDVPTAIPPAGPGFEFRVAVGSDPEGSPVVAGFRLYHQPAVTWELFAESGDLPAVNGEVGWNPPPMPDGAYMWRAWAGDGEVRSDLCPGEEFMVDGVSSAGNAVLVGPSLRVLGTTGGHARLQVGLTGAAQVVVDVFDVRGARVRRLHDGHLEGGERVLTWDGRDGAGRGVASGVYLLRARIGSKVLTGRVVLVH